MQHKAAGVMGNHRSQRGSWSRTEHVIPKHPYKCKKPADPSAPKRIRVCADGETSSSRRTNTVTTRQQPHVLI